MKKTNKQIAEIIKYEGLEYAITDYLSSSDIEDPILAELWKSASDSIVAVEKYLENLFGEEYLWE